MAPPDSNLPQMLWWDFSRKRKQYLGQITIRAAKSNKRQKVVRENREKKRFWLRQQQDKNFCDEYEEANSASSFDDSTEDKFSPEKLSSSGEDLEKEEDKGRDNTFERLGMMILSSST